MSSEQFVYHGLQRHVWLLVLGRHDLIILTQTQHICVMTISAGNCGAVQKCYATSNHN